ncbi:MAG: TonB-dependent receptor, partial [Bacteroidales bacterium]|nr:TonB-dependent receptor [Bacteroidales bacterium]
YDRRHNINLVTSYNFGKQKSWGVDVRWNFGSGLPFTQVKGYYENITFNQGSSSDPITDNGELAWIYGDYNAARLPAYHRLDISLNKRFVFSKKSNLEINASVTNVYNRKNIFYVNRLKGEVVYQMPIMPSLGINYTF